LVAVNLYTLILISSIEWCRKPIIGAINFALQEDLRLH
jgi:hypothetical protein